MPDNSSLSIYLSFLACFVSALSALYARWTANEAKKANHIERLNALLAMRAHYLALIERESKMANTLSNIPSGLKAVQNAYADLDAKLRDVGRELDLYHSSLVNKRT